MKYAFVEAISRLEGRLYRRLTLAAIGRAGLAVCAGMIVLCGMDYFLRINDTGLRVIITGLTVLLIFGSYLRFVHPVLRLRINGVMIARWLEQVDERWRGQLAAAWEFARLTGDDPRWGSPELRSLLLYEIESNAAEIRSLCRRLKGPGLIVFYIWLVMVGLIGCGFVVYPVVLGTALIRLFNPFSDLAWPQRTYLKVVRYPEVVSRGGQFVIEVAAERGVVPEEVWIGFRDAEGDDRAAMVRFSMARRGNRFYFQRDQVRSDFEFRIWGGDDFSHPWRLVRVVEPPHLTSLVVQLEPPAYTGWKAEVTDGPILAVAGTQVMLHGMADRALRRALIVQEPGRTLTAELADDRRNFRFPPKPKAGQSAGWQLETSGRYSVHLEAEDGTFSVGDPAWEIRVIPDLPPVVAVQPQVPFLLATRVGRLPLRISARDDLALKRVTLDLQNKAWHHSVTIMEGAQPYPRTRGKMSDVESWGETKDRDLWLDLGQIEGVSEGTLTATAVAEDYHQQSSTSNPLTIDVVTQDIFRDRMLTECEKLYDRMSDIYNTQSRINQEWRELWTSGIANHEIPQNFGERMYALDLLQTQVCQEIGNQPNGVLVQLRGIVTLLQCNYPDLSEWAGLVEAESQLRTSFEEKAVSLQANCGIIARWAQQITEQQTAEGGKRHDIEGIKAVAEKVDQEQISWQNALQNVLKLLAGFKGRNSFRRQLELILLKQKEINHETQKIGVETVGKSLQELPPEARQKLAELAREESLLAADLETLLARFGRQSNSQQENDRSNEGNEKEQNRVAGQEGVESAPGVLLASEDALVARAVNLATQSGVVALMRDSTEAIGQNRVSEAVEYQKRVITILEEMLSILEGNKDEQHINIANLQEFARTIERLKEGQRTLVQEFEQRWQNSSKADGEAEFATKQATIRSATEKLLQQISPAEGDTVRDMLERIAREMKAAEEAASAKDRKSSLEHGRNALTELERTHRTLSERGFSRAAEEASRLLAEHAQKLAETATRQAQLLEKTRDLNEEVERLTTPEQRAEWQKQVNSLAREQEMLQSQIREWREKLSDWTVWESILGEVEMAMGMASKRLQNGDTGELTQAIQREVLESLGALADGMRFERRSMDNQDGGPSPGATAPDAENPGGSLPWQIVLQLQTLRALQDSIHRRTDQVAQELQERGSSPAVSYTLDKLSSEQARVVQLIQQLKEQMTEQMSTQDEKSGQQTGSQKSGPPRKSEGPPLRPTQPGTLDDLLKP
ncbi:hypothetical protein [Thermogutta sp.]|uniref:hypothetical protein n=1 Tax=Thermogutta sp. TaxID=1962930 RepID=UPI00322089E8